jgi:hypothetical protein
MCGSDVLQAISQTSMWAEYASGVWRCLHVHVNLSGKKERKSEWIYYVLEPRNEEEEKATPHFLGALFPNAELPSHPLVDFPLLIKSQ